MLNIRKPLFMVFILMVLAVPMNVGAQHSTQQGGYILHRAITSGAQSRHSAAAIGWIAGVEGRPQGGADRAREPHGSTSQKRFGR